MTGLYEETARRFAEQVKFRLGDSLHSVVLYGSVARGTAHGESDIDVVVVTDNPERTFDVTEDIAYELELESKFRAFVAPVEFSPQQLEDYLNGGDPFLEHVLREGKVLYDDGTFGRLRRQIVAART